MKAILLIALLWTLGTLWFIHYAGEDNRHTRSPTTYHSPLDMYPVNNL